MQAFGIKPGVSFCFLTYLITQSYSETTLQWIEHLGCFDLSNTELNYNIATESKTLGRCQHHCMQHTTYFAFKGRFCICFPTFNSAIHNRSTSCSYQVFHVIYNTNIQEFGNCVATTCTLLDFDKSDVIQYSAKSCNSAMPSVVCGNGVPANTNYRSQKDAFTYCHEMSSFLPGPSQFPCKSMKKSDQGFLSSSVWSAIFRVSYNDTGSVTTTNKTVKKIYRNTATVATSKPISTNPNSARETSYIANMDRTVEHIVTNTTNIPNTSASYVKILTTGILIGAVVGVTLTGGVILFVKYILFRKRKSSQPDLSYDGLHHAKAADVSSSNNYDIAQSNRNAETTYEDIYPESSTSNAYDNVK